MSDIADMTQAIRSIKVESTPRQVFTALTDPTALSTWFAQHVDVDPREGGRFRFWGQWTFDGRDPSSANQTVEACRSNESLSIRWKIKGQDTILTFKIQEDGEDCIVTATHDLPNNSDRHLYWLALDGIEIYLYNLKGYVEAGKPLRLPDYEQGQGAVLLDITVNATPGDVFAALTEPEIMNRWLSSAAEVELKPGGAYSYGWTDDIAGTEVPAGPKRVVAIEPGRLLTHDWEWSSEASTKVTWEISNDSGSTTVTLTHSGFDSRSDVPGYVQGWTSFLCKLKSMFENLDQPKKPEMAATG